MKLKMHELKFVLSFTGDSYVSELDEHEEEIDRLYADFGTIYGFFEILKKQPYSVQKAINTISKLDDFVMNH